MRAKTIDLGKAPAWVVATVERQGELSRIAPCQSTTSGCNLGFGFPDFVNCASKAPYVSYVSTLMFSLGLVPCLLIEMNIRTFLYHSFLRILTANLCLALVIPCASASIVSLDLGAAKPYSIIQLGNNSVSNEGDLDINSNSSIFGSTLKGKDNDDKENKLSTSQVSGGWVREQGVSNSKSSSVVGSQSTIGSAEFNDIANDAISASAFWAGQSGTLLSSSEISKLDDGGGLTLVGSGNGANVFDLSNGDFNLNNTDLVLHGTADGQFFVFNVPSEREFKVNSGARIVLSGGIEPEEVLFNVLGSEKADASIQSGSTFRGTLLATQRNVLVSSNHFSTFDSNQSFSGTTVVDSTTDSPGIFGQIVAGGKIVWSESDMAYHPFMTMPPAATVATPEPASLAIWGLGIVGIAAIGYSRRKRSARSTSKTTVRS